MTVDINLISILFFYILCFVLGLITRFNKIHVFRSSAELLKILILIFSRMPWRFSDIITIKIITIMITMTMIITIGAAVATKRSRRKKLAREIMSEKLYFIARV